jgi:hypothetical protein
MGWWRIDPETGKPAEDGHSKLSRPPDFVLLNAVPGVDTDDEAHYLGDGPWDMAADTARHIRELVGSEQVLPPNEVRALCFRQAVPPGLAGLGPDARTRLLQLVEQFWADIDWCYDEDWERPARPAERRWVCEYLIRSLTPGDDD